jgi:hypothetical protein
MTGEMPTGDVVIRINDQWVKTRLGAPVSATLSYTTSAMKLCPFCAEEIQDAAIVCKHCGRDLAPAATVLEPLKPSTGAATVGKALAVGCLGFIALMIIMSLQDGGSSSSKQGSTAGAYDVCQKFVTDRLRAPGSARFPSITADGVQSTDLGDGRYSVRAYVDSQNGFGALLRMTFACEVNWQSGQSYKLVDLQLNDGK